MELLSVSSHLFALKYTPYFRPDLLAESLDQCDFVYVIPMSKAQCYFGVRFTGSLVRGMAIKALGEKENDALRLFRRGFIIYPRVCSYAVQPAEVQAFSYKIILRDENYHMIIVFVDSYRCQQLDDDTYEKIVSCWHAIGVGYEKYYVYKSSGVISEEEKKQLQVLETLNQAFVDGINYGAFAGWLIIFEPPAEFSDTDIQGHCNHMPCRQFV